MKMAYIFIIIGIALVGIGIYLLINKPQPLPQQQIINVVLPGSIEQKPQTDSKQKTNKEKIASIKSADDISKEKGNEFEDFIIQTIGKLDGIKFIGKNSDYHKNGVSALENKEPDLKFACNTHKLAIECKWRSAFHEGQIIWAENYQIDNYNKFQKENKQNVLIAIGIGGSPSKPKELYMVPLYRLTQGFAKKEYISEYSLDYKLPITFDLESKCFKNIKK